MTPLLNRLAKWLSKHRSRFYKNLQVGADAKQFGELEKSVGKPLPSELRTLLSWRNGQGEEYVGYFIDHWIFMDTDRIALAKEELDATGGEYGWSNDWLPFLDDDGGNYMVLDASKKRAPLLIFWMGEKAEKVAPSLEAWLTKFVTDLEAGHYFEDTERGTLSRSRDAD